VAPDQTHGLLDTGVQTTLAWPFEMLLKQGHEKGIHLARGGSGPGQVQPCPEEVEVVEIHVKHLPTLRVGLDHARQINAFGSEGPSGPPVLGGFVWREAEHFFFTRSEEDGLSLPDVDGPSAVHQLDMSLEHLDDLQIPLDPGAEFCPGKIGYFPDDDIAVQLVGNGAMIKRGHNLIIAPLVSWHAFHRLVGLIQGGTLR